MLVPFTYAIVRKPGPNCAQGITTSCLGDPEYDRIVAQHAAYVEALSALAQAFAVTRDGKRVQAGR